VRVEEAWIPMSDGVRLAATLYMPDEPLAGGSPPILEYLPYRKDDGLLERDHRLYGYLVARGFVGARVDLRGTGRSQGNLPAGEYTEQEHRDGLEVIAWLAQQPWSTGTVGMWGISWGGFNAIQVAALGPPALKAIVAVDASDDLFHDDIHYVDGLMHLDEYELMIDQWNPMTRAPDFPTDEDSLHARFDADPWLPSWLRNQRDGPFWRRASLRPDYERLRIPALLVGGWYDGYRDSIPRMMEHVPAPTRAIVGPWNHTWPHSAEPGPAIEWREEVVRWWDHWLRGRDTGLLGDPPVRTFVRDWHPPDPTLTVIPGRWRADATWPPEGLHHLDMHLAQNGSLTASAPNDDAVRRLPYRPTVGAEAGVWWGELTVDQATLDAACLMFDSLPLDEDLVVLGPPEAVMYAAVDAPLAHFFVRVCDVAPDERSTLVSGGGLNGAHRRSAAHPEPLEPGRVEELRVPLRFTSWVFPAGHRIRVAVSNALWPMIWPTPHPLTLELRTGPSRVRLPIVSPSHLPEPSWPPPEAGSAPPGVGSEGELLPVTWEVRRSGNMATASWEGKSAAWFPWGRQDFVERLSFEADDTDPSRASAVGAAETRVSLHGRTLLWRSELELGSDAEAFRYRYRRQLDEDDRRIRERRWEERIPRDHQ
jgi:uncharacterized protein